MGDDLAKRRQPAAPFFADLSSSGRWRAFIYHLVVVRTQTIPPNGGKRLICARLRLCTAFHGIFPRTGSRSIVCRRHYLGGPNAIVANDCGRRNLADTGLSKKGHGTAHDHLEKCHINILRIPYESLMLCSKIGLCSVAKRRCHPICGHFSFALFTNFGSSETLFLLLLMPCVITGRSAAAANLLYFIHPILIPHWPRHRLLRFQRYRA